MVEKIPKAVQEIIARKEKQKWIPAETYIFKSDYFTLFISNFISTTLLIFLIEGINNAVLYLKDRSFPITSLAHPLIITGDRETIIIKILLSLIVLAFITPTKKRILFNKIGIFGEKNSFSAFLFAIDPLFIKWNDVKRIKFCSVLYKDYIIFYNEKNKKIGRLFFAIRNKQDFIDLIKTKTGVELNMKYTKS